MGFEVHLSQKADQYLKKLDNQFSSRINKKLKTLSDNQVPSNSKFIGRDSLGDKIFRLRIGDYRATYKVKDKKEIVLVTKVDKRPRIYDR